MHHDDGSKKPLGRIALRRTAERVASPDPAEALARQRLEELAAHSSVPAIDLDALVLSLEPLGLVPEEIAARHRVLPVAEVGDRLWLAMADPSRRRLVDEVEFVTGRHVFPCVAPEDVLDRVIREAYRAKRQGGSTWRGSRAEGETPTEDPASALVRPPAPEEEPSISKALQTPGLPAAQEVTTTRSAPPPRPRRERPLVLVVDDEADIRKLLGRVLAQKGYDVVEAADGRAALQKVAEATPDVVLLDAMLPEVHGFDICRRLKRDPRFAHLPIVMVSAVYRGWRIAADLQQAYGVAAFLEKPFKIADVLQAVERALAGQPADETTADEEAMGERARELLQAGLRAYHEGDGERAVALLREAAEADPLAFEPHYQLGLLHGHRGELFEAIGALEAAVDLQPGHLQALRALAVLYQRTGFRHKAIEMWERALSAAPDDETRRSIKGQLLDLL